MTLRVVVSYVVVQGQDASIIQVESTLAPALVCLVNAPVNSR
jgi:hypothetical protein